MSLSYHIPNFVSIGQIFHHSCRSFCGEACPAITIAHYQCVFFLLFFFASQPPVSVLHNFVDGRGGGRGKDNRSRRNERLCPRCPWLSAVFCQQSLSWQLYGKRSGNLFNVFLYQKIDFLISKNIKKYFLISKYRFFISKIDFLISEIDFLISENIFWYQKYFWYKKWKSFLISKSKSYFLISKNEFLISENTE